MMLAVRKDEGSIPGAGFHYMLHPHRMESNAGAALFEAMGYVIIDVPETEGVRMLAAAGAALAHQIEVAVLTEKAIKGK